MTTNHIDQLTEWWETAEKGAVQKGDIVIERVEDGQYNVFTAFESEAQEYDEFRILTRAPKPAWHDAVAVIAHTDYGHIRQVWERDSETGYWLGIKGSLVRTDTLNDVTPLIEAKVTDEMVDRARNYMSINTGQTHTHNAIRGVITTALGLDPA